MKTTTITYASRDNASTVRALMWEPDEVASGGEAPRGLVQIAVSYTHLTTPDESYHGVVYTERFGLEGAFITKATAQLMRDLGSIQSPQNAYLLNLGLESLHVRMPQHCKNGQAMAEFLAGDVYKRQRLRPR